MLCIGIAATALSLALPATAQDWEGNQDRDRERIHREEQQEARMQEQAREQIYGSQLMTLEERQEYRDRMRDMATQEERDAFRAQHHGEMQQRAREQGVELPEEMPSRGQGTGRSKLYGNGPGGMHGPGGGRGSR